MWDLHFKLGKNRGSTRLEMTDYGVKTGRTDWCTGLILEAHILKRCGPLNCGGFCALSDPSVFFFARSPRDHLGLGSYLFTHLMTEITISHRFAHIVGLFQ